MAIVGGRWGALLRIFIIQLLSDAQLLYKVLNSLCVPINYKPCIKDSKGYDATECANAENVFCITGSKDFDIGKFGSAAGEAEAINLEAQKWREILKPFGDENERMHEIVDHEQDLKTPDFNMAVNFEKSKALDSARELVLRRNKLVLSQQEEKNKNNRQIHTIISEGVEGKQKQNEESRYRGVWDPLSKFFLTFADDGISVEKSHKAVKVIQECEKFKKSPKEEL